MQQLFKKRFFLEYSVENNNYLCRKKFDIMDL